MMKLRKHVSWKKLDNKWTLINKMGHRTRWEVQQMADGDRNWLVFDDNHYVGEHRYVFGAKKIAEALFMTDTRGSVET